MDVWSGDYMRTTDTLLMEHEISPKRKVKGILSLLRILICELGVNYNCEMFSTFLCICFTNKPIKESTLF